MIGLNLTIINPWMKENFSKLFNSSLKITKNKVLDFEIIKYTTTLFEVTFNFTTRQDHAGILLSLGLLGFIVQLQLHDIRHWNYLTNNWEI